MKTKEELNALKEEVENLNKKLAELTDEEIVQVSGGCGAGLDNFDYGVSGIVEKMFEAIKEVKEKAEKLS